MKTEKGGGELDRIDGLGIAHAPAEMRTITNSPLSIEAIPVPTHKFRTWFLSSSHHHHYRHTHTGLLMGTGNPLLDISANVPQEVLDEYDVQTRLGHFGRREASTGDQELVDSYNPQFIAGGATQNSIRVAQWMMMDQKGNTAFMGCVGVDAYGTKLEDCATADGVLVHYMKDETTPTGTCACLIKDGERALIANLAAANNFKPTHLETDKAKEIIASAKFYYMAGFSRLCQ
jgi:adenosine kinase